MRRLTPVVLAVLAVVGVLVFGWGGGGARPLPAGATGFRPQSYTPRGTPTRILDTRDRGLAPGGGSLLTVDTGAAGAVGVGVNIALTETVGPGFLTAWDCDGPRPLTSVLNSTEANENISNFVIVPVNGAGNFCVYTNSQTHIVIDLMGVFTPDAPPPTTPAPTTTLAPTTTFAPTTTLAPTTTSAPTTTTAAPTPSIPFPPGISAEILWFVRSSEYVSGRATNLSGSTRSFRIEVACPLDDVGSINLENVPNGQTHDWLLECESPVGTFPIKILRIVET